MYQDYNVGFLTCINNWEITTQTTESICTCNLLKQQIKDCCTATNQLGVDSMQAFLVKLREFQSWCIWEQTKREQMGGDMYQKTDETDKSGVYVPMTKTKYTGTIKRVFNTHQMRK